MTFHPVTLENAASARQMEELLAALDALEDTRLIFTLPNADPDGLALSSLIQDFVDAHANARAFASLGQLRYLSCIRHVDGVVGNSSSGLAEVPSFAKGTIKLNDNPKHMVFAMKSTGRSDALASLFAVLKKGKLSDFRALRTAERKPADAA